MRRVVCMRRETQIIYIMMVESALGTSQMGLLEVVVEILRCIVVPVLVRRGA